MFVYKWQICFRASSYHPWGLYSQHRWGASPRVVFGRRRLIHLLTTSSSGACYIMKMKSDTKLVNELDIVKYLPKKKLGDRRECKAASRRGWIRTSSSREYFFFSWDTKLTYHWLQYWPLGVWSQRRRKLGISDNKFVNTEMFPASSNSYFGPYRDEATVL
jgi:hypothetical protein